MAPEYAFSGLFSTKSDVYSFGVVVLEIVSGKRSRFFHNENHGLTLIGHVRVKILDLLFKLRIRIFVRKKERFYSSNAGPTPMILTYCE